MHTNLVDELRDALAHLYDHAYLETHPIAEKIVTGRAGMARTRAQETRRVLLDAIELLNPGDNIPLRAPERRAHGVLFGLYVEGRELHEVADSLGIGERQLRRDRAAATEALAIIMQDRYLHGADEAEEVSAPGMPTEDASPMTEEHYRRESLGRESRQLAYHNETFDLFDFFEKLLPLLSGLAHQHHVEMVLEISPALPPVTLSYPLLRQIMISLASQCIHSLPVRQITFLAEATSQMAVIGLKLTYPHDQGQEIANAERQVMEDRAVGTMLAALDGKLLLESQRADYHQMWIFLPRRQKMTVLVVDDKHDLYELFMRYLVGHPYQLHHAASVDQGLRMVEADPPDIILLDLMMPERDGWEFLQALSTNSILPPIPVIVCSVLHEPELAFSLGAQHYLKKPVEADDLLLALEQVRRQVLEGGAHPVTPAPSQSHPTC